jgi:hypothetical protein
LAGPAAAAAAPTAAQAAAAPAAPAAAAAAPAAAAAAVGHARIPVDVRFLMQLAGTAASTGQLSGHLERLAPGNETVPSLRGAGAGRREGLKCKAANITRSAAEAFAYVSTKTLSQRDARDVLGTFCYVSPLSHSG